MANISIPKIPSLILNSKVSFNIEIDLFSHYFHGFLDCLFSKIGRWFDLDLDLTISFEKRGRERLKHHNTNYYVLTNLKFSSNLSRKGVCVCGQCLYFHFLSTANIQIYCFLCFIVIYFLPLLRKNSDNCVCEYMLVF